MKKLKLLGLGMGLLMAFAARATTLPGYYVGTQFLGTNNSATTTYGQSFFAGYQFSCFWALEGAAMTNFASNSKNNYQIYSILGKGMFPFGTGFDIFGKAGFGFVTPGSTGFNQVAPIIGAGVSYDITPQFVTDLSYNRLINTGGNVSNISFYGLGLTYHFCEC